MMNYADIKALQASRARRREGIIARRVFLEPQSWNKTERGNWTRDYDGARITIFRKLAQWWWCVSITARDDVPASFSASGFDSLHQAKDAVWVECLGGQDYAAL